MKQTITQKIKRGVGLGFSAFRRHAASPFMDFPVLVACKCGGKLEIKDHRFYPSLPTASKEWRYEVRCDKCLFTDPNGYASHAEVLDAYVPNNEAQPRAKRVGL